MDSNGAFRCIHAAEVYRRAGPCPVIVSGGKVSARDPGPATAEAMRDLLIHLGVAPSDIIVESASRTTYENAVNSCELLEDRNLGDVVLVTDAAHMYRSVGCFRALGVDVMPAACNYRATSLKWSAETFLPRLSRGAENRSRRARMARHRLVLAPRTDSVLKLDIGSPVGYVETRASRAIRREHVPRNQGRG